MKLLKVFRTARAMRQVIDAVGDGDDVRAIGIVNKLDEEIIYARATTKLAIEYQMVKFYLAYEYDLDLSGVDEIIDNIENSKLLSDEKNVLLNYIDYHLALREPLKRFDARPVDSSKISASVLRFNVPSAGSGTTDEVRSSAG